MNFHNHHCSSLNNMIDFCRPSKVKQRLFKYYPLTPYHLESFKRHELFFARPSMLNDSFDTSVRMIDPYKSFKERIGWGEGMGQMLDYHGICSFTEGKDVNNEMMWSFYANNFQGYAIEYNPEALYDKYAPAVLSKVKYLKKPLNLDNDNLRLKISDEVFSIKQVNQDDPKYCDRLFHCLHLVKSSIWSRENEWRIIMGNRGTNHGFNMNAMKQGYYLNVETKVYRALFVGYRVPNKELECLMDIASGYSINVYMVEPSIMHGKWDIIIRLKKVA